MSREYGTLRTETVERHILLVTLDRPEVSNALNTQMGGDLLALWSGLSAAPGEVRAVVLTGAGSRTFCAGADLKERNGMTREQWEAQHEIFERQYWVLLACDFIYAARTARFALTEVTLGIMPGAGGTQFLPRAVGERRAKEIIFLGKPFGAEDALQWGLVNRVCEAETVVADAVSTAQAIAANAPLSIRQAKKSVRHGLDLDLKSALLYEIEAYNRLVVSEDRSEGISAFNDKR